jgi:hypothetical protein
MPFLCSIGLQPAYSSLLSHLGGSKDQQGPGSQVRGNFSLHLDKDPEEVSMNPSQVPALGGQISSKVTVFLWELKGESV